MNFKTFISMGLATQWCQRALLGGTSVFVISLSTNADNSFSQGETPINKTQLTCLTKGI